VANVTADADVDSIEIGTEIPSFVRTTGFANWNRFAAVNDEFVPIHMDDEAGRAAGFPSAIGMGSMQLAYLHALIREWHQGRGRLIGISCQFRAPNTRDSTVTARGVVSSVVRSERGGRTVVDEAVLDIWTEGGDGTKLAVGVATVAFRIEVTL
jgi:acyl dehydratase